MHHGIPKEQLADLLATADIGLMTVRPTPILELNCANKFFDYLASGLPIALNYGGWQARTLEQTGSGLAARMGDQDGFVALIRGLACAPERREEMSGNARRTAEQRFDRDRIVAGIVEVIETLPDD